MAMDRASSLSWGKERAVPGEGWREGKPLLRPGLSPSRCRKGVAGNGICPGHGSSERQKAWSDEEQVHPAI